MGSDQSETLFGGRPTAGSQCNEGGPIPRYKISSPGFELPGIFLLQTNEIGSHQHFSHLFNGMEWRG